MTPEEFGTFYETHAGRITTFLAVKFRDEELAQDAIQHAALYVSERLDKYRTLTLSYFRQLATNRALDILQGKSAGTTSPKYEYRVGSWFDLARGEDPTTVYGGTDPDAIRCVSEGDEK